MKLLSVHLYIFTVMIHPAAYVYIASIASLFVFAIFVAILKSVLSEHQIVIACLLACVPILRWASVGFVTCRYHDDTATSTATMVDGPWTTATTIIINIIYIQNNQYNKIQLPIQLPTNKDV